jgi:hypothetical protein
MLITRIYQNDCTVGILETGDFRCFTLELPDLDNQQNISCIPDGTYTVNKHYSERLGACFNIQDVEGRTFIRIHTGNYTRQIQGCILVGSSLVDMDQDGTIDVSNSLSTLKRLFEEMPDEFKLTIM